MSIENHNKQTQNMDGHVDSGKEGNSNPGSIQSQNEGRIPGTRAYTNQDLENRWLHIQSDYRSHYPEITNEDVNYRPEQFDNMIDRVAKRTNRNREQVIDDIKNWQS